MAANAVQALVSAGHEVTVVAGRPSYDPTERHAWRAIRTEVVGPQLRIIRVGSTAGARSRMTARVANYLSYGALATAAGISRRPDVVLAMTDPPFAGAVGLLAARTRSRPLVYWVQDLHPDATVAAGIIGDGVIVMIWRAIQRVVLRKANLVVVLGDDMGERVSQYGVKPNRVEVVRSGATLGPTPLSVAEIAAEPVVRALRRNHRFLVLHAGNLGYSGAWQTILEAAEILAGENIGFAFVGTGALREKIEGHWADMPHVAFHDYRPSSELPLVLAAADIHVVSVRRGLEGLVVPSKLYAILAAGRPVLAVASEQTDVARLVRKYGCGLVADPDNPAAVSEAIHWASSHSRELTAMGQRSRDAAGYYRREEMLDRLVEITENVVLG
ncbi:MAG: glycosyltransferase family 4 protein [Acidimicrobiales bacterium]